jgi:hypothetical protein
MYCDHYPPEVQVDLKYILKYETESLEEKYLRLHVFEGRVKRGS